MIHNNKIRKNMFKDCLRDMKLPILFEIISTEVLLVVPTMVALLIGELTNYLLDLNIVGIKEKLIPFIIAILLFVFGQPITRLLRNIVIFRQSLVNDRSILRQYLKKYIKSAKAIDEGEVCERLEYDLVQYRFNTINLICRPVIVILYVIQIVLFFMNKVYIPYIIAIAVISIFPVLLSHFFSNLNAKCLKGLREFEEKRKNAEFVFFESHDYIRGNLLTPLYKFLNKKCKYSQFGI